jgi:hypothetical protein
MRLDVYSMEEEFAADLDSESRSAYMKDMAPPLREDGTRRLDICS